MRSILAVMQADLEAPDHTTLSRRSQRLDLALDRRTRSGSVHLVVDSTGLSVFGEGEWATAKHGGRGKRGWKKLHLGVDRAGVIVTQALTEPTADDAMTGVGLVTGIPGDVASVTADAAYDTIAFYDVATDRGAQVVVPPLRTASLSRRCPRSRSRDRTIGASAAPRPSAVKEGREISSTGSRGERGLSVQVDHRTWSASPNDRRAADRSAPRVQRAESDDRARSARVLPHRSLRGRRYGRVPLNVQSCNNAMTFYRVRALAAVAHGNRMPAVVSSAPSRQRTRPPRLTEPWFC